MMRRALRIDEASYGQEHPHIARDRHNPAQLLYETRRPTAEALSLIRRAIIIDKEFFGPTHANVGLHLTCLAQLLQLD